ncbi:hypothetical protein [Amycolatopsis sp. NPDC059657]|uniref:hypothetical protein n=1 Tax=Amycolatopsis sp. NPDC059657 TaxID=3346899 RepID=UPI00366FFB2A
MSEIRTPLAVHRTILAVDVRGFGDRRRTTPHQVAVRDGMYRAVKRAFRVAGLSWGDCHREDRGDGLVVLAPAETPKGPFAETLPLAVVAELREHNATHPPEEQIRLLDAPALKKALASSPGVLSLIASGWFFDEVVRNSPVLDAATFRPVRVAVKETSTVAWISLPDHPYPAAAEAVPEEEAARGPAITMTATSSDNGRVYQAARDQHITER